MKTLRMLATVVAVAAVAGIAGGQVGDPLPAFPLTDFAQTEARSLEDFEGRLLLLEVFAYW